jgi:hypothetical protein
LERDRRRYRRKERWGGGDKEIYIRRTIGTDNPAGIQNPQCILHTITKNEREINKEEDREERMQDKRR